MDLLAAIGRLTEIAAKCPQNRLDSLVEIAAGFAADFADGEALRESPIWDVYLPEGIGSLAVPFGAVYGRTRAEAEERAKHFLSGRYTLVLVCRDPNGEPDPKMFRDQPSFYDMWSWDDRVH